jgi:glutamyl-tRNA synthetase
MEDLDPGAVREEHLHTQPADLRAIGVDWDGAIVRQSARRERYEAALARLVGAGLTYECFCSRREVREAASAPHGSPGAYPGTCRELTDADRRRWLDEGRRPALRLRAGGVRTTVVDRFAGPHTAAVDDIVLRRGDGTPAYHLVVVVDDADQGVEEVVRGDDLLPSSPSQAHLATLLGLPVPMYAHVPLALGPDGARLAKRHGAVSLDELSPADAMRRISESLGLGGASSAVDLLDRFDPARLPTEPWIVEPS